MTKHCNLYTLEGIKPALAGNPYKDFANRLVVRVQAVDGSLTTLINGHIAQSKFRDSEGLNEGPTFYAC